MSKKILWFDNDAGYITPFADSLQEKGFAVTIVPTITDAERFLNADTYDLLILDAMIPTQGEEEEKKYASRDTDHGFKMGVVFYNRMKAKLEKNATQVLALTVRLDQGIVDEFQSVGLDRSHIASKFDLRDFQMFLERIGTLLGD